MSTPENRSPVDQTHPSPDIVPASIFPGVEGATQEDIDTITTALNSYIGVVEQTGLVQGLLVGSQANVRKGYIWNVFARDFTLQDTGQTEFHTLSGQIHQLTSATANALPLRISNVNPSNLDGLMEQCGQQNIDVDVVQFEPSVE